MTPICRFPFKPAIAFAATLLLGAGAPALALDASLDADGDDHADLVEIFLGADPGDPASTPESVAVVASCIDGADNDLDGLVDAADPGCHPQGFVRGAFPAPGLDVFDSEMILDAFALASPLGVCPLDFDGRGPVVVERSAPVDLGGGLREIDVEIVAMQLTGTATLAPGSPCNPGPTGVDLPATIVEHPALPSAGKVTDTNPDPGTDFPADSFFDVFFLVDTPLGLLPGGPPGGPPGAPLAVVNLAINTLPPFHSPANPGGNPNCYLVGSPPNHLHCPKPPLDHFKCYKAKFPPFKNRNAFVLDQFLGLPVKVIKPHLFCNPVSKNQLPIFDPGAHLKLYQIRSPESANLVAGQQVVVLNQFGAQPLVVEDLQSLAVPTEKEPEPPPLALDHFTCYRVQGPSLEVVVTLDDQFDHEVVRVSEPLSLCNPAFKFVDGQASPVGDFLWHLVCYRIKPPTFTPVTVVTHNQFGDEVLTVRKPDRLCVPSLKFGGPGPPPPPEPPR